MLKNSLPSIEINLNRERTVNISEMGHTIYSKHNTSCSCGTKLKKLADRRIVNKNRQCKTAK